MELSGEPLGIDGNVLIRFKKLNENMLTSNIPTKQTEAFNLQRPLEFPVQQNLFGIPLTFKQEDSPHVNIGYLPDKFWLNYQSLFSRHF